MFTKEIIMQELLNRGYNAELQTVTKNGVELAAITIKDGRAIAPVIYVDEIIKAANDAGKDIDTVINDIIKIYEEHTSPDIDINTIMTIEFYVEHLMIGLQRTGSEDIIKRPSDFEGIEEYLYISGDQWSFKVKPGQLEIVHIPLADAWTYAIKNTCKDTEIVSMQEMLDMLGCAGMPGESPLYIVTNKQRINGAAGILNIPMLEDFAKDHQTEKIMIIPSSRHDCLIMPYDEKYGINEVTQMIIEINKTEVDPVDQLGDQPYIINVA